MAQLGDYLEDFALMGDIGHLFATRDGWRALLEATCAEDLALLYVKRITRIRCRAEYSGCRIKNYLCSQESLVANCGLCYPAATNGFGVGLE